MFLLLMTYKVKFTGKLYFRMTTTMTLMPVLMKELVKRILNPLYGKIKQLRATKIKTLLGIYLIIF